MLGPEGVARRRMFSQLSKALIKSKFGAMVHSRVACEYDFKPETSWTSASRLMNLIAS